MPQLWCALIRTSSPVGVQGGPPEGVVPPQKSAAGGLTDDHGAQAVSHCSQMSSPRNFSGNHGRVKGLRTDQRKEARVHQGRQLVGKMLYGRTQQCVAVKEKGRPL